MKECLEKGATTEEDCETGARRLSIFEKIHSLGSKNHEDSTSECSEREDDSLQTNSTGSPNDSIMELEQSSFYEMTENLIKDTEPE